MRRFRTLRIPERVHPLVRRLYEEMNHQRIGIRDLADRAGVSHQTIENWRRSNMPQIDTIDAAFQVLGMRLTAVHGSQPLQQEHDDDG